MTNAILDLQTTFEDVIILLEADALSGLSDTIAADADYFYKQRGISTHPDKHEYEDE
jgi:hypothetical protein